MKADIKYRFQLLVLGEWVGDFQTTCIAVMVRYANNYQGQNLEYGRTYRHLKKGNAYYFNRQNGNWTARIITK